ncbi:MAG: gamma-glutamylcyclotransferase [Actinomycetia bacterium]|nr:gamma-glutamylcyclotransferase [Actinomycetes bacterium]
MNTTGTADPAPGIPGSSTRLAVYGTLAPGRPNHHQLTGLSGRWLDGTVRGQLREEGWGAKIGYPGITLDDGAPLVEVQLFESSDLPDHWARLDAFEESGYRRIAAIVATAEGDLMASIYVLAVD